MTDQGSSAAPRAGGITLDRYLDQKGVLAAPLAVRVVLQLAAQLAREKKPAAITPQRVRIVAGGKIELLSPTIGQVVLEAPEYASPEEIRGESADVRSVLYSLGCTFYELIVGEPPYVNDDPDVVLRCHLESPVPDPREHVGGVPLEIAKLLRELLAKERDFRIQTPQQLAVRLRAIVEAPAASAAGPPRRPAATRPRRAAAADARRPGAATASRRVPPARSHGRAPARRERRADEDLEEGRFGARVVRRKAYPFTIAGACLGVLIGFLVALSAVKAQRALPAQARAQRDAQLATKREKALANRREEFRERFRRQDQGISARVAGINRLENPADIRDGLLQGLDNFCDGAAGPAASKRLISIWEEAQSNTRRLSRSEAEEGFRSHREEADRLYAEGKLGEAIKRIRRAEAQFQSTHGEEIDAFIGRLSQELEDRWRADLARVKELARAGEPDAAIDLLRKAMDYGDYEIRRVADRTLQEVQAQALISDGAGDAGAKSAADAGQAEEADGEEPKDDAPALEDDLESEFEEFGRE